MKEQPKFALGERVFLARQRIYGVVTNNCWITHLDTYQYLVQIEDKKLYKMCFQIELEKVK